MIRVPSNRTLNFYLVFILTLFNACKKIDCAQLPNKYSNYSDAIYEIKSASFQVEDELNTSKSSWVRGASYYSCDGIVGYLIIQTDEKEYIHQGVPIELWNEFKKANSYGQFYNYKIKGRYRLYLKGN
jgi:hypothetical protein